MSRMAKVIFGMSFMTELKSNLGQKPLELINLQTYQLSILFNKLNLHLNSYHVS